METKYKWVQVLSLTRFEVFSPCTLISERFGFICPVYPTPDPPFNLNMGILSKTFKPFWTMRIWGN